VLPCIERPFPSLTSSARVIRLKAPPGQRCPHHATRVLYSGVSRSVGAGTVTPGLSCCLALQSGLEMGTTCWRFVTRQHREGKGGQQEWPLGSGHDGDSPSELSGVGLPSHTCESWGVGHPGDEGDLGGGSLRSDATCPHRRAAMSQQLSLRDEKADGGCVCQGSCNRMPQTGQLKQQELICSQFWKLEVQDQVVGKSVRTGSVPGLSLCVCVQISSFSEVTRTNSSPPCEALVSKRSLSGLTISPYDCGGAHLTDHGGTGGRSEDQMPRVDEE
jgi:hypothetical protein